MFKQSNKTIDYEILQPSPVYIMLHNQETLYRSTIMKWNQGAATTVIWESTPILVDYWPEKISVSCDPHCIVYPKRWFWFIYSKNILWSETHY